MSYGVLVVSPSPLPERAGGWNVTVGPVALNAVDAEEDEELFGELRAVLGRQKGVEGVLRFSCRALAGEIADGIARVFAERVGGVLLVEGDLDVISEHPRPTRVDDAASIEAAMLAWVEADRKERAAKAERARGQWDARLGADPSLQADDDWSKL